MAKKRKSSTGSDMVASFDSNDKTRRLEADFDKLCKEAVFEFSIGQHSSPAKYESRLWKTYKFLWWKNQSKLDELVNEFLLQLPFVPHSQRSAQVLLTKLDPLVELSRTPRTNRFKDTDDTIAPSKDAERSPPPSPSQGRGLTRVFKTSKSATVVPSLPEVHGSSLPPPPPQRASARKPLVQTILPQSTNNSNRPATEAVHTLGVSFKSTTNANQSFNKTSFWSDVQGTQRTVDTAATSFSENEHPAESTDYGSMISLERANSLLQQLEATQKSDSTLRTLERRAKSDVMSCVSEFYCSSIDTHTADEFQARADIFHAESCERRDTIMTVIEDEEEEREPETIEEDAQTRITAVNAEIYNHEGPCKRQRLDLTPRDELIETGLVQLTLSRQFWHLPFLLQWEVKRVLQTGEISPEVLDAEWKIRSSESLYELVSERRIHLQHPPKPGTKGGTLRSWETFTLSAKLEWSKSKVGPPFILAPQVQRKDTSCSLQRKLGADRVLYVDIPELSKPPAGFKNRHVLSQFYEWIKHPQDFLGRSWNLFFLRPNKKTNTSESRASTSIATIILVAPPSGQTISDVVQWWFPYGCNKQQPSRKAYMRLELSLSRTVPAVVLKPEDFAYRVQDQLATRDPDDRRFEDPAFINQFEERYDKDTVMSDGCYRMSRWIAMQFANTIGMETIPPVLQIRTAGSKGLWYIDNESDSVFSGKPSGPLIHLANSQVKVFRDSLEGCDDEILTVGVVKSNPGGRPSILHMLFLPILVDRGVSLTAICELVSDQVREELGGFIRALEADGGLPIRQWFASRQDFFESTRRDNELETLAGFPISRDERVIQMLEAGFDPKQNAFLAREIKLIAAQIFDLKNRNFTILLPNSTTLWGIADPENCLEPGEVCVNFGARFNGKFFFLDNKDVLVARNPALAPWDIQKVRCVYKQQLARFPGMIVFSAKGMRPLANKLQGGDYDGDSFWVTWEEKLVADFKNAPAPLVAPPPETFGIRKDRSLLSDHIQNPHSDKQWSKWLGDLAAKRLSTNMLGIVTMYHERLVYNGCPVGSEEVTNWVHCHDYLVDSDKAGYDFDMQSFEQYKKSRVLPKHLRNLRKPTYYEITRHVPGAEKDKKTLGSSNVIGEGEVTDNVIDVVFFKVAEPIIQDALARASIILGNTIPYDSELANFYNQTIKSYPPQSAPLKEIHRLRDQLKAVKAEWTSTGGKYPWAIQIERLRNLYDAIEPLDPSSDIVTEWLRRQGKGMTIWDKLKASTLAHLPHTSNQLLFGIAGRELCFLKINEQHESFRSIIETQYRALKVRKPKTVLSGDHNLHGVDDEEVAVETGYF